MIHASEYKEMLLKINNAIQEGKLRAQYIGILLTRPALETGKNILESLNYYHELSEESFNFYFPGYGAYWNNTYSDEKVVAEVDEVKWFFSDKAFVKFIRELQKNSRWKYSGESELLLLQLNDGELSYEGAMVFHLDAMIRDKVIDSIPAFFQDLFGLLEDKETLEQISDALGWDKLKDMVKDGVLEKLPWGLGSIIQEEKYFYIRNLAK